MCVSGVCLCGVSVSVSVMCVSLGGVCVYVVVSVVCLGGVCVFLYVVCMCVCTCEGGGECWVSVSLPYFLLARLCGQ